MIDAIVAGHLCVDIIPTIPAATAESASFLAPGRLAEVDRAVLSTGGSVSNTGLAMERLGLDVRLVARIGDDAIGSLTRDLLAGRDPRLVEGLSVRGGDPSSYTIVISPPGGDRSFLHCPGTNNSFGPEDISDDLMDSARLMHFGYPPLMRRMYADGGDDLSQIYCRAKSHGLTTSLDMAMPDPAHPSGKADWEGILTRVLPLVDVFLPSAEELLYMLDRPKYERLVAEAGLAGMLDAVTPEDIRALADEAISLGAQIVAIKLGHRGLYLRTPKESGDLGSGGPAHTNAWLDQELWSPCFVVDVAGTNGAGDCTIAGFLTGMLRNQTPEQAVTSAVATGACNVERPDATSGVRSWSDTMERIERGWDRRSPGPLGPDWRRLPSGVFSSRA